MRRVVGAALAAAFALGNASASDDGLARAPRAAPPAINSWSGIYVGAHAGGAWSSSDWSYPYDNVNSVAQAPYSGPFGVPGGANAETSWLGGFQIGYNYQYRNLVLGLEGEASWTGLKGWHSDPASNINHNETDFLGTLSARFGYADDRALIYGKVGGAWVNSLYYQVSSSALTVGSGSPPAVTLPAGTFEEQARQNHMGFLVGAGVEYALTPIWSLRAEYQYLALNRERITLAPAAAVLSPLDVDVRQRIQLVELGINYKLLPFSPTTTDASLVGRQQNVNSPRVYANSDYLLWWVKGAPLSVPLVSTGPDTLISHNGILNGSDATILYGAPLAPAQGGNNVQNFSALSGMKLSIGYWFDDAHRVAVEVGGFAFKQATANYFAQSDSNGSPGLSIPLYNSLLYLPQDLAKGGTCPPQQPTCGTGNGEDRAPISIPGELAGSVLIRNSLQLWGLSSNVVVNLLRDPTFEISTIGGVRYLNLAEDFNMYSQIAGISGSFFAGQSGNTDDDFYTRNQFYGAVLGLRGRFTHDRLSVETAISAALGVNHETIDIKGEYRASGFSSAGGPYGIFATPANAGASSSNQFAVVPEAQIKLSYEVTPSVHLSVGYDFLYISNVVRPTDQIDRNLVKGEFYQEAPASTSLAYPQRLNKGSDFFAQGLSAGVSAQF